MPYLDYILLLLLYGLFCFPTESLSTLLFPFVIKSLGSELFNNSLSLTLDPLPFFFFFSGFIYFWLCWVFIAPGSQAFSSCREQGLLFSCGMQTSCCDGFFYCVQGAGSIAVVHGLICSMACRIFPDQGSNQCLLNC